MLSVSVVLNTGVVVAVFTELGKLPDHGWVKIYGRDSRRKGKVLGLIKPKDREGLTLTRDLWRCWLP